MAGALNHRFESDVPDEGVSTEVGPDEWNDELVMSGGNDGAAAVRRTSATDGWELIYLGAPLVGINVTQAANSGTGETDLHSFTIPLDHFSANKRALRVKAYGSFADTANTKTLKLYVGTEDFTLNPTTTAAQNVRFEVEAIILRTAADAQRIHYKVIIDDAFEIMAMGTATEDDGAAIIIKLTGQSGTASSDILLDTTIVEYLN